MFCIIGSEKTFCYIVQYKKVRIACAVTSMSSQKATKNSPADSGR